MDKYFRLGFQRKPEHLQWYLPTEPRQRSDLTEIETLARLNDYNNLRKRAEVIYEKISTIKKEAYYELVLYPIRSAAFANERYFSAELAETHKLKGQADAIEWAKKSIAADDEIKSETADFNEKLVGGKWRNMMSPEMGEGQWKSMRSTPPKLNLADFENVRTQTTPISSIEPGEFIRIEAENFSAKKDFDGFGWQTLKGLGKSGDSVTIFPNVAQTFSKVSPSLDYQFSVKNSAEFEIEFFLIPTQPVFAGNGLQFTFSVDNQPPQTIAVDKNTEVSSRKWAENVLNQTTSHKAKIRLEKGNHILKIFAVDTGVILDKIVLESTKIPKVH